MTSSSIQYQLLMTRTYFEQYFDAMIKNGHAIRRDPGMSTKASNGGACTSQVSKYLGSFLTEILTNEHADPCGNSGDLLGESSYKYSVQMPISQGKVLPMQALSNSRPMIQQLS